MTRFCMAYRIKQRLISLTSDCTTPSRRTC